MSSVGGVGGAGEKPDAAKAKAAKGAFPGPKLVPSGGSPVVSGPAGAKPLASPAKSSAGASAKPAVSPKSAPASGAQKSVATAPSSGAQKSVAAAPAAGAKPAPSSGGPPGGKAVAKAADAAPAAKAAPPARPSGVSQQVADFARGMVQAADAASQPGPTSDGDLLPRESVSGLFMRDFALQGAIALGRPPLGEDEAARIVIEKHLGGESGRYYDAKVSVKGDDQYIVNLHRLSSEPPFLPEPSVEASYQINRKTWQIEES